MIADIISSSTSTFMDPQTSELPASFGSKVQDQLTKLGVDIKFSTRVESPTATSISPVDVKLSNGEVIKADFYVCFSFSRSLQGLNVPQISCIGVTPNSSFLPANFLDSRGWIKTLPTLQTDADTNIFAIGLSPHSLAYSDHPLIRVVQATSRPSIVNSLTKAEKWVALLLKTFELSCFQM